MRGSEVEQHNLLCTKESGSYHPKDSVRKDTFLMTGTEADEGSVSDEEGGTMESYLEELVREAGLIRNWTPAKGLNDIVRNAWITKWHGEHGNQLFFYLQFEKNWLQHRKRSTQSHELGLHKEHLWEAMPTGTMLKCVFSNSTKACFLNRQKQHKYSTIFSGYVSMDGEWACLGCKVQGYRSQEICYLNASGRQKSPNEGRLSLIWTKDANFKWELNSYKILGGFPASVL